MYAKRCVVMRPDVAMSHCRSVQIEGLAYKPSDRKQRDNVKQNNALFGVLRYEQNDKTKVRQHAKTKRP
jgi:RecB family endonuclease NucS